MAFLVYFEVWITFLKLKKQGQAKTLELDSRKRENEKLLKFWNLSLNLIFELRIHRDNQNILYLCLEKTGYYI